jgi:hypothetical protein
MYRPASKAAKYRASAAALLGSMVAMLEPGRSPSACRPLA